MKKKELNGEVITPDSEDEVVETAIVDEEELFTKVKNVSTRSVEIIFPDNPVIIGCGEVVFISQKELSDCPHAVNQLEFWINQRNLRRLEMNVLRKDFEYGDGTTTS